MRVFRLTLVCALACSVAARAQGPDSTLRRQQRILDSLSASVRALQDRVDSLERAPVPATAAPVRSGGAYMNLGFDGLSDFGWSSAKDVLSLQRGDHDPHVRGFTVPNVELTFD